MPEGDSVHRSAGKLQAALSGRVVTVSDFRVPQHATADLRGTTVQSVVARGKHLLTRFDNDVTLHTHFEMDGRWSVVGAGKVLPRRLDPDVRVVLGVETATAYGLLLPVVELLPTNREDDVVGHLGPDILGADWDLDEALRRLLRDAARPVVEALLDQKNLAGIGNLWANETLFLRGHFPWTPVGDVELAPVVRLAQRMMRYALVEPGQVTTGDQRRGHTHWGYGRTRQPCRRCGTPIQFRDEAGHTQPYARATWWCPYCQPGPAP